MPCWSMSGQDETGLWLLPHLLHHPGSNSSIFSTGKTNAAFCEQTSPLVFVRLKEMDGWVDGWIHSMEHIWHVTHRKELNR